VSLVHAARFKRIQQLLVFFSKESLWWCTRIDVSFNTPRPAIRACVQYNRPIYTNQQQNFLNILTFRFSAKLEATIWNIWLNSMRNIANSSGKYSPKFWRGDAAISFLSSFPFPFLPYVFRTFSISSPTIQLPFFLSNTSLSHITWTRGITRENF
jgi:hypothetical protein